ncbi:MAG: LAGLIDADG homing endonuclease [Candidatus Yanofskybacteria bacterium GW2011_GWA1_44_21]|uniref:LAGLIDADG homing endonuclease n=1 Tax=Candidatus Yanofskybacteria bacterium GW2011_GWB1_45_11 TaxID=1619026 RepID=A0A0G1L2M8_9BACT|nr:MAG: LAGLIDADG homing endonuclease [Candidatus Yanofskybacteria bacterium GW2011_GWA1_44_21]KKT90241.1 MAG: LAGLIDADG homing endonuclease [Candidatus Yanofskybacteria bacterium GW2011_GWB1_45_11]
MLTREEKNILVGSLLGDGCLRIMQKCKVPAFSVSHSEVQKDYVFWKYEKLKRWVKNPPWREERIYHKDKSRKTFSWRFQTLSNEVFSDLYQTFYENGKKIIPENIEFLLKDSPLILAVWLMDDGNKNHQAVFLNTQSFSLSEQQKLCQVLHKIYGFDANINKHSKSNGVELYRIRINTESTRKLKTVVKNYLLPLFYYKIPDFSP